MILATSDGTRRNKCEEYNIAAANYSHRERETEREEVMELFYKCKRFSRKLRKYHEIRQLFFTIISLWTSLLFYLNISFSDITTINNLLTLAFNNLYCLRDSDLVGNLNAYQLTLYYKLRESI